MSISSIGSGGLTALEKAQMVSGFKQTQTTSLVSGLPTSSSTAIGSDLMYNIYDQKALTPRILAATLAKSEATTSTAESSSTTDTTTSSTASSASTSVTDSIIAQSVSAHSSAVPATRPDYLVSGIKNVDLSA